MVGGGGEGAGGWGGGCQEKTLIVSCLEWLTSLFLFIMVEFEKVLYSPDLKMVLIFLLRKSSKGVQVQMGKCLTIIHEMLCHAIVIDKPGGLSVCSQPLPQENFQLS